MSLFIDLYKNSIINSISICSNNCFNSLRHAIDQFFIISIEEYLFMHTFIGKFNRYAGNIMYKTYTILCIILQAQCKATQILYYVYL